MNIDTQQTLSLAVLVLAICFGLGYCQHVASENDLRDVQIEQAKKTLGQKP